MCCHLQKSIFVEGKHCVNNWRAIIHCNHMLLIFITTQPTQMFAVYHTDNRTLQVQVLRSSLTSHLFPPLQPLSTYKILEGKSFSAKISYFRWSENFPLFLSRISLKSTWRFFTRLDNKARLSTPPSRTHLLQSPKKWY